MRTIDEENVGIRLTFWGISSDASDERGRELFERKFGRSPAKVIRFDKSVLLMGPIVKDVDDSRRLQHKKSSGGL